MAETFENIVVAALALPPEARAQLAEQLLNSLDSSRGEVDKSWAMEIQRRIREVENGQAQLIPHDDVMARARQRIASA